VKDRREESYQRGADLAWQCVRRFRLLHSTLPLFAFPPADVALIASMADVGEKLARNEAAKVLLVDMLHEFDRKKMGDYPTVMMLKIILQDQKVPILTVPFEELGLNVEPGRT
jgi:hypothetical protein